VIGRKSPSPNKRKAKVADAVRKVSARQAEVKWTARRGSKRLHAENPTLLHFYWPDHISRA
jgi:hypothetical protein